MGCFKWNSHWPQSKNYIHKRKWKRNQNKTLKIATKPQVKKEKKKQRGSTKTAIKQFTKWQLSTHLSIITSNVNRLNYPIKRHRIDEAMSPGAEFVGNSKRHKKSKTKPKTKKKLAALSFWISESSNKLKYQTVGKSMKHLLKM